MIVFGFVLFAVIIFLPLMLGMWKRVSIQRDTYSQEEDFYKAQLASLERDHAAHLLDQAQYENARLEVQRRLLGTTITPPMADLTESRGRNMIALSSLLLLPLFGIILYSINGTPFYTAQSADDRAPAPAAAMPSEMLKELGARISTLTPKDPDYGPKHILLGQIKAQMGLTDAALADWRAALAVHFTPELALQIAETETTRAGRVTPDALTLYHQALDAAPKDAPWRLSVEARIAAGEHDKDHATP